MRVARIISSQQYGRDHEELKRRLQAAGYEVETAAPGQFSPKPADLEVELERWPAEQALDAAVRMASDGLDVFVAPGVVPQPSAPASKTEAADAVPEAALQSGMAAEPVQTPAAAADAVSRPSLLQRAGAAWSERQRRAEHQRLERERLAREEEERRRQQTRELQRRREQEERIRAERLRVLREEMAREAVLRAERARKSEENERRRAADLAAQAVGRAQPPDPQRLAAIEAQMQASPAAAMIVAAMAAPRPVTAPIESRRVRISRRPVPSPRQRQWRRAALLAALATVAAMLGFSLGSANLHPLEPMPANMLNNNAQQQVPFGPATISPAAAARQAPTPAPATVGTAPTRKFRPSAAWEKPVHQPPRARRSVVGTPAADDVVVRHYPSAGNVRAQQSQTGVRRYSDQD